MSARVMLVLTASNPPDREAEADNMRSGSTRQSRSVRLALMVPAVALALAALPAESQAAHRRGHKKAAAAGPKAAGPKATGPRGEIAACESAYKLAQENESSSHLVQARELWLRCARPSCGAFFRQECTNRFTQLDADIPSVIPFVTDAAGTPRVDVDVKMDGESLTTHLDGHALPIDPGVHEFSFSTTTGVFATQQIMILQGQRNRPVSASLRSAEMRREKPKGTAGKATAVAAETTPAAGTTPAPVIVPSPEAAAREASDREASEGASNGPEVTLATAPAESHKSGHAKLSYILGGAGLLGIGGAALLTYWGRKDNDMLGQNGQCADMQNACSQGTIDHIKRLYLAADVSLGVGVAALGAAYWVYAAGRSSSAKEEQATQEAYRIDVQPARSGAVATVSGSF
jgi:hypothetical protein